MARERYDVRGKTVLITGAARGIGAGVARRLHAKGANVALAGLEPDLLGELADELGDRAAWFEADVASAAAMEAAVEGAVERFGGLDVVMANAGVAPNGTVTGGDPELFERTIDVNLLGVYRTLRPALPYIVERQGYALIVASAAAAVHLPMMAAYAASKAGVEALGDSLRQEVAHTGTRVGVAYFSFIDTDMVRQSFDRPSARKARERNGAMSRVAPLPVAVDAVVRGIERRARQLVAPRSVWPALYLRTLLQPLAERQATGPDLVETMRLAEAEEPRLTTPQPERQPR